MTPEEQKTAIIATARALGYTIISTEFAPSFTEWKGLFFHQILTPKGHRVNINVSGWEDEMVPSILQSCLATEDGIYIP